ncbi:hypothetical protein AB0F72_16945 [Actinoplanes sp. NPDC023936]|uniref:hypothetical protein n=1 Tax=Actinoplanes sp. NPDC023936 TaxID=3154910 RepID=UPI0033D37B2C
MTTTQDGPAGGRTWGRPFRAPIEGLRGQWWRRYAAYPVLLLMAGADGFGFWNTLTGIIQRDTTLVLVFVVAMSIGSVALPHEIGRVSRSRQVGYGGSIIWIFVLSVLWLGLGATMWWLRASDRDTSVFGNATGALAPKAPAAASAGFDQEALHIALLLLVLFLMTGALAMGHGYRWGDPRLAEVRAAYRAKAKLFKELSTREYEVEQANGNLNHVRADQVRVTQSRDRDHEIDKHRGDVLRSAARIKAAETQHDPAATDALNNYPRTVPSPRTARRPYDDPPEI